MTADEPAVAERGPQSDDEARPRYTVRAAAQLLGVPTATLRSWTRRYGIGPAEHRPGAHRLYSDNDLQTLRHMRTLIDQGVSPEVRRGPRWRRRHPAMPRRLRSWPPRSARRDQCCADHRASSAPLRGARHLGLAGAAGLRGYRRPPTRGREMHRHRTHAVVGGCALVPEGTDAATWTPTSVILACTADETHALPLEALRAALCERGCGVLMLGPRSPSRRWSTRWRGLTAEGGGDLVANCRHRGCGHDQDGRQGGTTGDGRGTRVGLRAPATGDGAPKSLRDAVQILTTRISQASREG
ncbi:helix-turn-helix domain protein [Mycobacterium xenopi 4042]|uniref:Helix-turn-helix domain protein n=1 Tax=Mycobacterium xenopi 4042 TaxID=1299334 RepID=X8DMC9_MYCXE|nr:helix-turn-helix domain protein [Mycobacterium xenopi 4042]